MVLAGVARGVDQFVFDVVQSVRAPWLDVVGSLVSLLGQTGITAAVALGIAVARARHGRRDAIVPLFILAVFVIEAGLKLLIPEAPPPHDRSRGADFTIIRSPFTNSFPSGHVARFAFLAGILDRMPRWAKGAGIAVMAVTRIYIADHWLSGTIGGAILGTAVAVIARQVARGTGGR